MAKTTRRMFVDSSVLTAFIDRGNPRHLKAAKAIEDTASIGYSLYVSSQVISDSYAILAKEVGVSIALEFLQTMFESGIEILYPQRADLLTSQRILKANRERQILLSEALNATLMQKKGITQILTFRTWSNLFGTSISNLTLI